MGIRPRLWVATWTRPIWTEQGQEEPRQQSARAYSAQSIACTSCFTPYPASLCCETSEMITLGIDLATEPSKTALASIKWENGHATVVELCRGKTKDGQPLTDEVLVDRIQQAHLTGIDCPFGWPDPFIVFLNAQAGEGGVFKAPDDLDQRRQLAYRLTDINVGQEVAKKWGQDNELGEVNQWAHMPLSVSSNFLGLTAMRMASLSAKLATVGTTIDKSGNSGKVIEVYPAASLAMWGLPNKGYKGADKRGDLGELVDKLQSEAPWLDLEDEQEDEHLKLCRKWDDAFDALIASLTARAHHVQGGPDIGKLSARVVEREGWIVLPRGELADLPTGD